MVKHYCDKCEVETSAIIMVYVKVNYTNGCRLELCKACEKELFGVNHSTYTSTPQNAALKFLEELKEQIKQELRDESA